MQRGAAKTYTIVEHLWRQEKWVLITITVQSRSKNTTMPPPTAADIALVHQSLCDLKWLMIGKFYFRLEGFIIFYHMSNVPLMLSEFWLNLKKY